MAEVQVRPLKATLGVWLFLAPASWLSSLCLWLQRLRAKHAGQTLEAEWNKTVDRAALVPWNVFMLYNDVYYEDEYYEDEPYRPQRTRNETAPCTPKRTDGQLAVPQPLAPMRTSMQATMAVGNDSASLPITSAEHRMTFWSRSMARLTKT